MTRKQRLHFLWLVVCNAQRIMDRCNSVSQGSEIITSATDKRAMLGLPCRNKSHSSYQKTRQMRSIIADVAAPYIDDDVKDPF